MGGGGRGWRPELRGSRPSRALPSLPTPAHGEGPGSRPRRRSRAPRAQSPASTRARREVGGAPAAAAAPPPAPSSPLPGPRSPAGAAAAPPQPRVKPQPTPTLPGPGGPPPTAGCDTCQLPGLGAGSTSLVPLSRWVPHAPLSHGTGSPPPHPPQTHSRPRGAAPTTPGPAPADSWPRPQEGTAQEAETRPPGASAPAQGGRARD